MSGRFHAAVKEQAVLSRDNLSISPAPGRGASGPADQVYPRPAPGQEPVGRGTNAARRSPNAATPSWLDLFDPRQPEAFLAFCSGWSALQMWIWPDQFASANALISFDIGLLGHERVWAVFAGVGALLKLAGLASRMSQRWAQFSDGLRASGLFMSVVFWLIVGLSRMIDFPHLIMPVALTGLGIAAAFELADRHDPRETWR
jgi:hypothetical protein